MSQGLSVTIVIFCVSFVAGYDKDELDEKADWKVMIKKLNELQNTVNNQNARISFLEKKSTVPETEILDDLKDMVNRQKEQILNLEKKYQDLQATITAQAKENERQTKLSYDQLVK
jgi:hypothetical protein